jgi:hypothetical protein
MRKVTTLILYVINLSVISIIVYQGLVALSKDLPLHTPSILIMFLLMYLITDKGLELYG